MNDRLRQIGKFVTDTIQEAAQQKSSDRGDYRQLKGFTKAAGISLRLIQDKIDAYKEQMKGPGLNKTDQAIYTHLDELKCEIEAQFDRHWQGSGVDWRPPKSVVKGAIKQAGEPQP